LKKGEKMRDFKSLLCALSAITMAVTSVPTAAFSASAEDGYIYGTMEIPYSEFFAAEDGVDYEVDAVSSATTSKFAMNTEGSLSEGTYNEKYTDTDGNTTGGKILGVTYPVAITAEDLASLGDNNYNFTELETAPVSYKTVSVEDGKATFSAVVDTDGENEVDGSDTTLSVSTNYGDFQLEFGNVDLYDNSTEVFYGAVVHTDDGKSYAMTILENWWRPKNQLAWSVGYIGSENSKIHNANVLKYNETKDLQGKTITSVDFITTSGYTKVTTDIKVPEKTGLDADVIKVENALVTDGSTAVTVDLPEDYSASYTASDDSITVKNGKAVFAKDTKPGKYTLTVSDTTSKYVSYSATFILSTEETVVSYDGEKLVAAAGVSDDDLANFISNITSVSVNGKSYSASGKGAVKLINDDGTINTSITSKDREGNETTTDYITEPDSKIVISANGYSDYELTYGVADTAVDTEPATTTTTTKPTTVTTTTTTTTTTTENTVKSIVLGDLNSDGKINSIDAVAILKGYAQSLVNGSTGLTEEQETAADVNKDGKINSIDAVNVLKYYAASLVDKAPATIEEFLA
jgi:hypothetical protein